MRKYLQIMLFCGCASFSPICAVAAFAADSAAVGADKAKAENQAKVQFIIRPYAERQAGQPGYKAQLDFIDTRSALYPHTEEIGRYINGQILERLFALRREAAAADEAEFCAEIMRNSAEPCESELSVQNKDSAVIGSVASVRYEYFYAPIGAAHPMSSTQIYNFSLKPLFRLESLFDIFADADKAFPQIQKLTEAALLAKRDAQGEPLLEKNMLEQGLESREAFADFALGKDGIRLIFNPYAVAPYAVGRLEIYLVYADLPPLKDFYRAALGLGLAAPQQK